MPKNKKSKINKFWKFVNLNNDNDETELQIYSDIAEDGWFGDSVTPKLFLNELKEVESNNICVRINSNGGDVFAANTIAVALEEAANNGKNVTCKIDGICASAAVRVALACSKVCIANGAYMMIHKPANVLFGYYNSDEMRKMAETLDVIQSGIVDAYAAKTGLNAKECSKLMDKETWFTANEAVEKGFADEILFEDGQIDNNEDEDDDVVNNDDDVVIDRIRTMFAASAITGEFTKVPKALKKAFENKTNHEEEQKVIKNYEELKAAFPDLVSNAEDKARAEGAKNERERIKAIDSLKGKIDGAMLNDAKYGEKKMTADEVIVNAFKADKMLKGKGYMNAAKADAEENEEVTAGVEDEEKTANEEQEEAENLLKNAAQNCRKSGGRR